MGAKRRQFTREFKLEAVRMLSEGDQPLPEVARELGIRADILRRWLEEAASRTGLEDGTLFPDSGRPSAPQAEIRRLRRELEMVRQERDFLKKAAAYFAKESR